MQQVGGGEPLRLTRGSGDKHEPAFSPDGTTIAFRSEWQNGAIYVVPALGGQATMIAPEGRRPQFSPDGNWIAYYAGSPFLGTCFTSSNICRIYIAPSVGGAPRQLRSDFAAALHPVWSPDGSHLLFLGKPAGGLLVEKGIDWWVTPLDSGLATKTGALEATRNASLSQADQLYPRVLVGPAWQPLGDALVFSARSGDTTNLWRIRISPKTWRIIGTPERLTSGPTFEQGPSVASSAGEVVRIAFAALSDTTEIWSLPIEPNQGKVTGELKRLTQDNAADLHPALSPNGDKLVFVSSRSGSQEIWIRDLRSGELSALTASRSIKWRPRFSPDGSKVSFSENLSWDPTREKLSPYDGYIVASGGGAPEMVSQGVGQLTSWSSDGKRILCNAIDGRVSLLELSSRKKVELLARPGHWLCDALFSPDDQWIAFSDSTPSWRTYVVPFRSEGPIGVGAWIDIMEGHGGNNWSPDGKLIYNISERDGFRCVWAQRVNPVTKRPLGEPFAVFHSHNARLSLGTGTDVTFSDVGPDKIVFNMSERTGNIWMAEWKER